MASTTALLTGLSGLIGNSRRLDVIGNNIANVNTTAYKSNRMLFAPTFSRTLSAGTSPGGASGGTNPTQVGLGVSIAGTQRNFTNGAIAATGVSTDLAIEGNGLFVVDRAGQQLYTRSGAFQLSAQRDLVTITGERVLGFGVDENFNVVEGQRVPINIPIGSLTLAEATQNVNFAGNLNAGGALPTMGSTTIFDQLFVTTLGAPMVGADLLSNLQDPAAAPGTALFPGPFPYTFQLSGAQRGGASIPPASYSVTAASTVNDLIDFVNQTLGIVPGVLNPDGSTSGAQINGAGQLQIIGNTGSANNIVIDNTDVTLIDSTGTTMTPPRFTFTQAATADGESVRTSFTVFDSLGRALTIDVTMVLDAQTATGTTWTYFVDSPDNVSTAIPGLNIASGTVDFDTSGRLITSSPVSISIGRENTGAVDPLTIALNFSSGANAVTALASANQTQGSTIAAVFQDGSELGVLASFSVGGNGIITGAFSNGLTRTIGQMVVATFTNAEGLVDIGNNLFTVGPNSGTPLITTPQNFGAGRIVGGALEQSNVDLGQEFIDLVQTSTGYSAAARVITTTDQLLQQLIALGR
ncbi:MAG: flagellar hook protein FlgE [Phycisphaerales bacterium]